MALLTTGEHGAELGNMGAAREWAGASALALAAFDGAIGAGTMSRIFAALAPSQNQGVFDGAGVRTEDGTLRALTLVERGALCPMRREPGTWVTQPMPYTFNPFHLKTHPALGGALSAMGEGGTALSSRTSG